MRLPSNEGTTLDFRSLDLLASGDTSIHRLDPRAKVLVALLFIITVVSFDRYQLSALLPFFLFPLLVIAMASIPAGFIAKKALIVIPFAVVIGIFNPLFDTATRFDAAGFSISGGWISFASILVRSLLTATAAILLMAVTGFPAICTALRQLGIPDAMVNQLLFMHRYMFVLADDGSRVSRARELRSYGAKGMGIRPFSSMVAHLLLRSWERAERIHMAMLARGYRGEFHLRQQHSFGVNELIFILFWAAAFMAMRLVNIPLLLGETVTGLMK